MKSISRRERLANMVILGCRAPSLAATNQRVKLATDMVRAVETVATVRIGESTAWKNLSLR